MEEKRNGDAAETARHMPVPAHETYSPVGHSIGTAAGSWLESPPACAQPEDAMTSARNTEARSHASAGWG
jgi:hypothetical protein